MPLMMYEGHQDESELLRDFPNQQREELCGLLRDLREEGNLVLGHRVSLEADLEVISEDRDVAFLDWGQVGDLRSLSDTIHD